jgi:hypothetical protein
LTGAAAALKELAEPWSPGDRIKRLIERAARRAGLPYWRAFDIWYGKARRIEAFERAAIGDALDKKRREAARNELHELRTRLARLESLLAQSDPDFHRPSIDAAREQARALGGNGGDMDRPGNRGGRP